MNRGVLGLAALILVALLAHRPVAHLPARAAAPLPDNVADRLLPVPWAETALQPPRGSLLPPSESIHPATIGRTVEEELDLLDEQLHLTLHQRDLIRSLTLWRRSELESRVPRQEKFRSGASVDDRYYALVADVLDPIQRQRYMEMLAPRCSHP